MKNKTFAWSWNWAKPLSQPGHLGGGKNLQLITYNWFKQILIIYYFLWAWLWELKLMIPEPCPTRGAQLHRCSLAQPCQQVAEHQLTPATLLHTVTSCYLLMAFITKLSTKKQHRRSLCDHRFLRTFCLFLFLSLMEATFSHSLWVLLPRRPVRQR